ncbi:hypothetical protein VUR80DRAFT_10122 [Thermomyces stellatus]
MSRIATRRLLALSGASRTHATAIAPRACQIRANSSLRPTVADAGFWTSLIPKPLRRSKDAKPKPKSNEWNPATFFIIIFLLIGSMSINTIAVKNDYAAFMRQADVRIGLLREVVEKLQRGEEVDVEQALGTGNPAMEEGWEEMLREIEKEKSIRDSRKQQKQKASEDSSAEAKNTTPESAPSTATGPSGVSSSSFY